MGDVHLGRRPSGLDEILGDHGLRPRELSPAVALDRVTEHACAHPPRAVVFAGDLVDQEDDCFEAYGDLERNVRALRERGIAVLAVAGNHDAKVLPRLIRRVEGVELLGADATWELRALEDDGPPVDLLAWSFKTSHHSDSPLDAPGLDEALGGSPARRAGARACCTGTSMRDRAATPPSPAAGSRTCPWTPASWATSISPAPSRRWSGRSATSVPSWGSSPPRLAPRPLARGGPRDGPHPTPAGGPLPDPVGALRAPPGGGARGRRGSPARAPGRVAPRRLEADESCATNTCGRSSCGSS